MIPVDTMEPRGTVPDAGHGPVFIRLVGRPAMPAPDIPKDGRSGRCAEDGLFHPVRLIIKGWNRLSRSMGAGDKTDRTIGFGKIDHQKVNHHERHRHILERDLL